LDRAQLTNWLAGYERAWRSPGTDLLAELFAEDASYSTAPYENPHRGLGEIAKMWEEELQLIVEEQQFLSHQEEFLADLQEDHKAVLDVYGHVEKVISLRGSGAGKAAGRSRQLARQVTGEADSGSLGNVMAEIRGNSVDPEKRLKAIAANEKSREKEKASQADEFQAELSGFVGGKKLKMTGGAEEADRVRQKRNNQTLKAMFTG